MKALMTTTLKKPLILVMSAIVSVMISACGSSGDDQNDLVELPTITTEFEGDNMTTDAGSDDGGVNTGGSTTDGTSTGSGTEPNPALYNGRHSVDLGTLIITQENPIDYSSRANQLIYGAVDDISLMICAASLEILTEDAGPDMTYTSLIQATEASDDVPGKTISIMNIEGPTDNFGVEYIYSFTANSIEWTSVAHIHYFSPDDVTFNAPAASLVQCGSITPRFGQNEAALRAILDSVQFLRGSDL